MEEKNLNNQQATPTQVGTTPPPTVGVTQPTPPPPPPPQMPPTTPPLPTVQAPVKQAESKKSSGLLLVAVILVVLIVVLGALYYIIINQSTKAPATPTYTKPKAANTLVAPTTIPTVTPTDDEILNSEIPDPTTDGTELNQDATGL